MQSRRDLLHASPTLMIPTGSFAGSSSPMVTPHSTSHVTILTKIGFAEFREALISMFPWLLAGTPQILSGFLGHGSVRDGAALRPAGVGLQGLSPDTALLLCQHHVG